MSVEKVRAYLEHFGVSDRIREFDVSSATVELAAVAVGVEPARIAKTLSFKLGDAPILVVAAGADFSAQMELLLRNGRSRPARRITETRFFRMWQLP